MEIFVEGLKDDIRRSVQYYWATQRSIRMHALITYAVSIDTTHANRKREHGTQGHKKKGPHVSTRAVGRLSTTPVLPEALLVSHQDVPYPRSTPQARHSSADPSDQSTYCRFYYDHLSCRNGHATGECPHVARGDAARLEAIREENYPAYHNAQKERYRT